MKQLLKTVLVSLLFSQFVSTAFASSGHYGLSKTTLKAAASMQATANVVVYNYTYDDYYVSSNFASNPYSSQTIYLGPFGSSTSVYTYELNNGDQVCLSVARVIDGAVVLPGHCYSYGNINIGPYGLNKQLGIRVTH